MHRVVVAACPLPKLSFGSKLKYKEVGRAMGMVLELSSVLVTVTKHGVKPCARIERTSHMLRCALHFPQTSTNKTEGSELESCLDTSIPSPDYNIVS